MGSYRCILCNVDYELINIKIYVAMYINIIICIYIDPDPPRVTISPDGPIEGTMIGDSLVINCTATINVVVDADLLTFVWTGPGGVITNDSRVTISTYMDGHDMYTSTLDFSYQIESDGGNYTCNVQFFNVSGSGSIVIHSPGCKFVMLYYYM